jgi:hypothetical protein
LHKALRQSDGILTLPGQTEPSCLELHPENWFGDKSLAIAFYDNRRLLEDEIRADGFASLSVQRNTWDENKEGLPSSQMPFFIEYDHGSKEIGDVAQQLLSYHLLARTRRVTERFPDLDIPNYAVPVIMIFSTESRLRSIHKRFHKLCEEEGITSGVPILLANEEDWSENAIAPDICRLAWESPDIRISFLDALLRASSELITSRVVLARHVLQINLKAARRITGAVTPEGLASQRAKQEDARDDAIRKDRLEKEQAQRSARLEKIRVQTSKEKSEPLALPPVKRRRKK